MKKGGHKTHKTGVSAPHLKEKDIIAQFRITKKRHE